MGKKAMSTKRYDCRSRCVLRDGQDADLLKSVVRARRATILSVFTKGRHHGRQTAIAQMKTEFDTLWPAQNPVTGRATQRRRDSPA